MDDYLETKTREERQGLAFEGIPDADLFYEDKVFSCIQTGSTVIVALVYFLIAVRFMQAPPPSNDQGLDAKGEQSKKLYHRQRLTKAQAILKGPETAIPVQGPAFRKPKSSSKNRILSTNKSSINVDSVFAKKQNRRKLKIQAGTVQQENNILKEDLLSGVDLADVWTTSDAEAKDVDNGALNNDRKALVTVSKSKKQKKKTVDVPAVVVDPAGCSINPDKELHQDAVAEAVAAEMRKSYDRDLKPTAPVLHVDYAVEQDELELLLGPSEDPTVLPEPGEEGSTGQDLSSKEHSGGRNMDRKTKKDRAKEIRRREEEAELAERKKHKAQRRDLSELKRLVSEVDGILTEQELRRQRRKADIEEKAANNPPRLSKHRFEPLPLQVLTTEEVEAAGGSLRQIKPTPVLIKDRFKSLQRRGVIEPRQPVKKKKGKRIQYIHSQRGDEAARRQAELGRTKRTK